MLYLKTPFSHLDLLRSFSTEKTEQSDAWLDITIIFAVMFNSNLFYAADMFCVGKFLLILIIKKNTASSIKENKRTRNRMQKKVLSCKALKMAT